MTVMDFPSSPVNGQTTTDGRYYFDSSVGSTGAWRSTPLPVGGLPAGSIMAWGTNTPPANWLLADGSAVSRSVYSSLFAVIGTQYGTGDGTTTFNLPDLRGRVPVGKNAATFGTLGATGGAETHSHTLGAGYATIGSGSSLVSREKSVPSWSYTKVMGGASAGSGTYNMASELGGSTDSGSTLPPYQVVNYIIKASAGWTAGDSELATRIGMLEQNPNISGNLTVAGTATFNGVVKKPNNPAFLAQPASNNNAANAVGIFTSVALNTGNCFSTSTGRFTASVAGNYMFSGAAMPQANTGMEFWRFRKNGVKIGPWTYAINGDQILTQTVVIPLAVNDYVDMFFVSDGYEYLFTSFSGHFIG